MNPDRGETSPAAAPRPRPSFALFGVGGAGCQILEPSVEQGLERGLLAAVNTDVQSLADCATDCKVQIGARLTRGLGAGGDPEIGRAAAEEAADGLRRLCADAGVVFIVAGLGGGTGTGASPVLARLAKEAGALVLAVVTLPFDCEGARRQRQAQRGLEELRATADAVICLPNQRVLKIVDENTSLVETFKFTDTMLVQGIRCIWQLVSQPGLIHVDFADLRQVLQDRHTESFFAHAEARGDRRAREVVEKLMSSPLLESGALLRQAEAVLVSLLGGVGLTMAEVNRVMDHINRECEGAQVVLGAAVEERLGDRLAVTVIATRKPPASAQAAEHTLSETTAAAAHRDTVADAGVEAGFFRPQPTVRHRPSKFVPPPPVLTPEERAQILAQQGRGAGKSRPRLQQAMLPLEIISKGRFERSEPTIYHGEDLDVPTYIRRGMVLN